MQQIYSGESSLKQFSAFLQNNKFSNIFLLADTNTNKHCIPVLIKEVSILKNCKVCVIPPGELNKTIASVETIVSFLLSENADRRCLLINVGGGMITDLGGFAASVYKRGIKFIYIPTSLMAMVDASIGGKTGVNSKSLKNMIGTFAMPEAVFVFPLFLETLPERELKSANAEIIKHILLSDKKKWNSLINNPQDFFTYKSLPELIDHSIAFKQSVVTADFRDEGKRQILNFGHTLGHAIESYCMDTADPLNHGESIAMGLTGELFLSHKVGGLSGEVLNRTVNAIYSLFPDLKTNFNAEDLFGFLVADKKNKKNLITFSLIEDIGKPAQLQIPSVALIEESIQYVRSVFVNKNVVNDIH